MNSDPFRQLARLAGHLPDVPQVRAYQEFIWSLRRALLARAESVEIGHDTRVDARFYYPAGLRMRIGPGVHIKRDVRVGWEHESKSKGELVIGDGAHVLSGVRIDCTASVSIGPGSHLGRLSSVFTHRHAVDRRDVRVLEAPIETAPVVIGDDVMIFSDVVVLPGVTIGHGAVVAIRSVVTRDVESYTTMAGVPAAKVGHRV